MKSKGILLIILILCGSFWIIAPKKARAEPFTNPLPVPYMMQGTTEWCWANSIAMVLQYYGKNVHSWDLGRVVNRGHDEGANIPDILFTIKPYIESLGLTLNSWEIVTSTLFGSSWEIFKSHLDSGEPIVFCGTAIVAEWPPVGGHVIVVTGYQDDASGKFFYVHDPSGWFVSDVWNLGVSPPYIHVKVPFEKFLLGWGTWWLSFSSVVIYGTPDPPQGVMYLGDGMISHHSSLDKGNNGYLYLNNKLDWTETYGGGTGSGQEVLPNEDILVHPEVANHLNTKQSYQVNIELVNPTTEESVPLPNSMKKGDIDARATGLFPVWIKSETLSTLEPGTYHLYITLWKPDPDYSVDVPFDKIGPVKIVVASEYDKSNLKVLHEAKIAPSGGVRGITGTADVEVSVRAYLHIDDHGWWWTLYPDAYMRWKKGLFMEKKVYQDSGLTPLEFRVNVYNPEGEQIYSGGWKTTDTDNDGCYGDYSHLGGNIPGVQSPVYSLGNMPDYITLKTKWRIYNEFWWPIPGRWIESNELLTASLSLRYSMRILSPTTSKPAAVGDPNNPSSTQAAVEVLGPLPISENAFNIAIGGKPASFSMIAPPKKIPGLFAFEITPPVQDAEGKYDFQVTINNKGLSTSSTQIKAIVYTLAPSVEPIEKGLAWLRTKQYIDGSWYHSVGITSLTALAFINSGYDESDPAVSKAIDYILSYVRTDGSIYSSYPEYETAIAILPLVATHNDDYSETMENAKEWLVASQWDEDKGITKDDWRYGGFGYGWDIRPDLSNTQWVLMGLDAAGLSGDDPTWKKAQIFLARCQNRHTTVTINFGDGTSYTVQPYSWQSNDGGFIYYPGASLAGGTTSYGSMTAAGIWSLLLCGVDVNDPRMKGDGTIKGALDCIAEHYTWDSNPGMPGYMSQRFVYYYYVTLSKALTMARMTTVNGHDWYQDLNNRLTSLQYPDGHWVSSYSGHGSEYIPELATAYSILALQTRTGMPPIERLSYLTFILRSNCLIRILDSEGKLVGYNYMTGLGENNIPTAVYSGPFSEPQYVVIVNPEAGIYDLELVGISEGSYELTIQGNYGEEVTDIFEYTGEIKPAELHGTDVTVTAIIGPVDVYADPPEFEEIIDNTPPEITVVTPSEDPPQALQDGVTLEAVVTDPSGIDWATFSIREPDGTIIDLMFEAMYPTVSGDTLILSFDTTNLPDGFYLFLVNASDTLGNEGSKTVDFSIRNWACIELLPESENNKAGRTMPVKFSLRVVEAVDPAMPFVYNEELTIIIYELGNPENPLQISTLGDTPKDYRIDTIGELYITNFKTLKKKLTTYIVEIWRKDMLIGSFEFNTVK